MGFGLMHFTILKGGRVIGPLDRQEIAVLLAGGQISQFDLAQRGDVPFWVPLRRLIPVNDPPLCAEPCWLGFRGELGRVWAILNSNPLPAGLFALAAGCLAQLLALWPVLLFAPPLLAAVFAAAVLLSRGRFLYGALLCVSAFVLPLLLLVFTEALRGPPPPPPFATSAPAGPPPSPGHLTSPGQDALLQGGSVRGVALPRPVTRPPAPSLQISHPEHPIR